jgi:hypothetical protein
MLVISGRRKLLQWALIARAGNLDRRTGLIFADRSVPKDQEGFEDVDAFWDVAPSTFPRDPVEQVEMVIASLLAAQVDRRKRSSLVPPSDPGAASPNDGATYLPTPSGKLSVRRLCAPCFAEESRLRSQRASR